MKRARRAVSPTAAGEIAATEKMLGVIKEIYELYGFEAVETPLIEFTEALGKFLPDQDARMRGSFRSRTMTKAGCRCAMI